MKPPNQPDAAPTEATEFDRFKDFAKKIIAVPKEEIDKREAEYQRQRKIQKRKLANKDQENRS